MEQIFVPLETVAAVAPSEGTIEIVVLICPTEGCADYYGAPNCDMLIGEFSGARPENRHAEREATGSPYKTSRAECPSCRLRGQRVVREVVRIPVQRPGRVTSPPVLPAA
jgi:hypothetical protein